jgi:lysophospholipid hydrolase
VMVVGMGDDPSPGEYERLLLSMKTTARKELVLLHPDRSVVPGSTRQWLKVIRAFATRMWLDASTLLTEPSLGTSTYPCGAAGRHYSSLHFMIIFMLNIPLFQGLVPPLSRTMTPKGPDAVTALRNLKDRVQSGIQKYRGAATDSRPQRMPHANDFARLARRIVNRSIGLVLGGGGARGLSHLVSPVDQRNILEI